MIYCSTADISLPHSAATASSNYNGLFLVDSLAFPVVDSQALASQIVARIEHEFYLTNSHSDQPTRLPISIFQPGRETPATTLRRVVRSVVPSLLAFAALIFRP